MTTPLTSDPTAAARLAAALQRLALLGLVIIAWWVASLSLPVYIMPSPAPGCADDAAVDNSAVSPGNSTTSESAPAISRAGNKVSPHISVPQREPVRG